MSTRSNSAIRSRNDWANGIEDYYALGEAPGRWTGHSAELLGLEGEIQPEQLTAVLDRRSDILFENRQLREYELMLDARQRICDRLEQRPRSLRERLRGPNLELAQAYDSRDGATTFIASTQRRISEFTCAQEARDQYLGGHADKPARLEQIEALLVDRVDHAVVNDTIETPEYLHELIGDYTGTRYPRHWIAAAEHVERHRLTHDIDDEALLSGT